MSEQALPEPSSSTKKLTFTVPHILKSISKDEDGFTHRDVREGGPRQIDFTTKVEFSETPVDESAEVFTIRATNQLNFGGAIINVINDEVLLPGFQLVPTAPTATEYLSKVGSEVMVSSVTSRHRQLSELHGKEIYRITRIFVTLP